MDLTQHLVKVPGKVDVGHTDEYLIDVMVSVTPAYAKWLKKRRGKDVRVMQPERAAFSSTGAGRHAVETLLLMSAAIVQILIDEGVPKQIARGLLPHEIFIREEEQRKKKPPRKRP